MITNEMISNCLAPGASQNDQKKSQCGPDGFIGYSRIAYIQRKKERSI